MKLRTILKLATFGGALLLAAGHSELAFEKMMPGGRARVHMIQAKGGKRALEGLCGEIEGLAAKLKTAFWLHRFEDEVKDDAAILLIECNGELLAGIRKLDGHLSDQPLTAAKGRKSRRLLES